MRDDHRARCAFRRRPVPVGASDHKREDSRMPSDLAETRRTAKDATLAFRPLTAELMDHLGTVLRGSWGTGCWCMYPRLTEAQTRALPGSGPASERLRAAMTERAGRHPAPGLLAFEGEEPVGLIAIAPRTELARVEASRTTPRVDDQDVWAIPCITVRKSARGRGIAIALIQAAVAHAVENGAPAVEAYPRAGAERTKDDNAFFGTEPMFRRAGFQIVRAPLPTRRNWIPRVTMRITP
jgi:GNAT superfamily N-acetyltransferase